jgi:hypothetical protein
MTQIKTLFDNFIIKLDVVSKDATSYEKNELRTANQRLYGILYDATTVYRELKGTDKDSIKTRVAYGNSLKKLNEEKNNFFESADELKKDDLVMGILRYIFSVDTFSKDQKYSYKKVISHFFNKDDVTREEFVDEIEKAKGINAFVRSLSKLKGKDKEQPSQSDKVLGVQSYIADINFNMTEIPQALISKEIIAPYVIILARKVDGGYVSNSESVSDNEKLIHRVFCNFATNKTFAEKIGASEKKSVEDKEVSKSYEKSADFTEQLLASELVNV